MTQKMNFRSDVTILYYVFAKFAMNNELNNEIVKNTNLNNACCQQEGEEARQAQSHFDMTITTTNINK